MVHEGTLKIGSLRLQHACLTEEAASEPSARTPDKQITKDTSLVNVTGQLEACERTVTCWHVKVFHRIKNNPLRGRGVH